MKGLQSDLGNSFPLIDKYVDCAGQTRTFQIILHSYYETAFLEAVEETDTAEGYRFEAPIEQNLSRALGQLRTKIRRGISQRYLISEDEEKHLAHDELSGRIARSGLIIDGTLLPWSELERMLGTHEGFPISIAVGSLADEF